MARYEVLFGYQVGGDEWLKFESDDLKEAVEFWREYPEYTAPEMSWYLYIRDNENDGEVIRYTEGEGED